MKKLYFIKTNGYNLLATIDEEKQVRYLIENEYTNFPKTEDEEDIKEYLLNEVEDDSSWETDVDFYSFKQSLKEAEYYICVETRDM